ncbi:MAG: DUF1156 domain-containing protein [Acidimicrobiales bacterium]
MTNTNANDSEGRARLIDTWFPCAAVDEACGNTFGSGANEKAIFTWFASRPIAQARAAVACALLTDDAATRHTVDNAIRGDRGAIDKLADAVAARYPEGRPVVLDIFSGRGIIPLEAARLGAVAVGLDLSPVATLAGRILADYPLRDWSREPPLPWGVDTSEGSLLPDDDGKSRLVSDVASFLARVGEQLRDVLAPYYPRNPDGSLPWGYQWAITIPCDSCHRRFPLIGNLVLRPPYGRSSDAGQWLRLVVEGDAWKAEVADGIPTQSPTYSSAELPGGKKRKGKSARCVFCNHVHSLEAVKAKGIAAEYRDELLVAADLNGGKKVFRALRADERAAVTAIRLDVLEPFGPYSAVPDERIPDGNVHTVMASGYGYRTFGALMCDRQTLQYVETVRAIRSCHADLLEHGISRDYAKALATFAAANVVRRLRRATRGCTVQSKGKPDGSVSNTVFMSDLFANEAVVMFQFDWFETGPGAGPSTWDSIAKMGLTPFATHVRGLRGDPARLRTANAMALPYRDGSVDAVVTDPPYYDMIEYADASDLFHVWLKRILFDIEPDLFGPDLAQRSDGLQNKDDEIIVRRVHEPGRIRHDKDFYEASLSRAFAEAKRVLRPDGHLVVVFGHSDPDAWRRLLQALRDAGFIVTSAWPARTESANTGVASIKVTVTIGCLLAPLDRKSATAAQVEREIGELIRNRVAQWDQWGLALSDQLMASYGPAMEVVGRYRIIERPDGSEPDLDHFLTAGRRSVGDAHAFKVDEIPLDTFDAQTRFAIFWLRAFGRTAVNKGEAVFHAQSSQMRIDDLRPSVLIEVKGGYALTLDLPPPVTDRSPVIHVARALAVAWSGGGTEAASEVIADAGLSPDDSHLWATIGELVRQLPESDKVAMALTACQRNRRPIETAARQTAQAGEQLVLDPNGGTP